MDKSFIHWKSENPLLLITGLLIAGSIIMQLITGSIIAHWISCANPLIIVHFPLTVISSSLLTLLIIQNRRSNKYVQGVFIYCTLILWGMSIFILTKSQDLIAIEYPRQTIQQLRAYLIHKVNLTIPNKEANAFAQAMLMGIKGDLDKSIMKAYMQLGIVHIIAISGMHLEIIYHYLAQMVKWLPRKKKFKWVEFLFILGGIWTYTFIAFASPSIVRATVFFSIYLVGRFFNLHQYTLNSIAAGLMIVLLFDHASIGQLGLQLSYSAVIGIHLFYPILNNLNKMDNPLLNFCWANLSVTIAAQITTLPILIFHFNQVSALTIISNFIMVPLSNILLYALLLLILCPGYFNIALIVGQCVQAYMIGLNKLVSLIYQLSPYEAPKLTISKWGVFVYYCYVLLIYLWLIKKQAKLLFLVFLVLVIQICIKLLSPV